MSKYIFTSISLLLYLLFTLFLNCSSFYLPIARQYSDEIADGDDFDRVRNDDDIQWTYPIHQRQQRAAMAYYPRANRNTWFRVSTYQHFKPSMSEEIPAGDNLLRWGR